MPLYFFHIRGKHGLERDDIGVDLADLQAVRVEAARTVIGFERDAELTGEPLPGVAFEVMDAAGGSLLIIPFSFIAEDANEHRTVLSEQSVSA